jgi:Asp-tRNA(Asn)/Glu-tRNA(Gln) amidotransferase A subunit family amidase
VPELRIGVLHGWFSDGCDPEVADVIGRAVETLKTMCATVAPAELPSASDVIRSARTLYLADVAAAFADVVRDPSPLALTVQTRMLSGARIPATEYARALRGRRSWQREVSALFATYDVLVTATSPLLAPPLDVDLEQTSRRLISLTYPFCFAGIPALSVPCGKVGGLPVGLLLVAPWGEERRILQLGSAFATG